MSNNSWGAGIQSRDEQRQLKRMAILRVAAQAFNQAGFRQTSLTDLAAQLNVTKPTLYYYVKNKDDILRGILEVAMDELRAVIATEQGTQANGLEKLRYFFQRYAAVMTDDFGACLILTRVSALETKFRDHYHTASREVSSAVRQIISEGIADGSLAPCDPKYVASALLGTMNETVYWHLVEGKESAEDTAAKFFTVFEEGLLPRD